MNRDVNRTGPGVSIRPHLGPSLGVEADDHTGMSRPLGCGGGGSAEQEVRLSVTTVLTTPTLVPAMRPRLFPVPSVRFRSPRRAVSPCVSVDSSVAGGLAALFFLPLLSPAATFLLCGLHGPATASSTLQPGEAYEGSSPDDDAFPLSCPRQLLAEPERVAGQLVSALPVFTLRPVDLPTRAQTGAHAVSQGRAPPLHWIP
jgi:hypothetical protein